MTSARRCFAITSRAINSAGKMLRPFFVNRSIPHRARRGRVLPDGSEFLLADRVARDKCIDDGLVFRIAKFDDDGVDGFDKSRIADQRDTECRTTLFAVVVVERNDRVSTKRLDDG
jgi:hypothetical protein